jgi:hypothetical protein
VQAQRETVRAAPAPGQQARQCLDQNVERPRSGVLTSDY